MKTFCSLALAAIVCVSSADLASAGGSRVAALRNYTNGTCHQKIDPKGLTGQAKKDAWKACKASPDTYN